MFLCVVSRCACCSRGMHGGRWQEVSDTVRVLRGGHGSGSCHQDKPGQNLGLSPPAPDRPAGHSGERATPTAGADRSGGGGAGSGGVPRAAWLISARLLGWGCKSPSVAKLSCLTALIDRARCPPRVFPRLILRAGL